MTCEACGKQFDPAGVAPGAKIACPYCGDVQSVPARTGLAQGKAVPDRAQAMGLPPDSGPEADVMVVHPSMFRARPLTFIGALAGLIAALAGAGVFYNRGSAVLAIVCAAAAVVLLGVFGYWYLEQARERLQITNKRVVWVRGIFSKGSMEVLHDRIQNIEIQQSFWHRLWGVGRISISSAGEADFEIRIDNVPNPYRIREVIDAYRPM